MEKLRIEDVEVSVLSEGSHRRDLSERLATTDVAINHYSLASGEEFPGGLHAHMDQEELFLVIEGEATFETMDGEVVVGEGEVVRFEPGEFQSGANESDGLLEVFALGAPRETEDIRIPAECPECSHANLRLDTDSEVTFRCPSCDAEQTPRDCPECGHPSLRFTLDESNQVIVRCRGCSVTFDSPPVRKE